MSRIVGYADINFAVNSAHLKRAALVTDEIRLTTLEGGNFRLSPANIAELMWVQEKGAVSLYEVGPDEANRRVVKVTTTQNWPEPKEWPHELPADSLDSLEEDLSLLARAVAAQANQYEPDISVTVIASAKAEEFWRRRLWNECQKILKEENKVNAKLQAPTAIEVVLHQMPVPDDETAWEDILTWRSDEAAREKYRRLKHWVHNVVGGTEQPKHLEDHLLTLLDDYRAHMRLHGMKVRTAQTKAIVVPIVEAPRIFLTGRWGEWANAYFTVKEQQHALLEAELKAPGREVAYIVSFRQACMTPDKVC